MDQLDWKEPQPDTPRVNAARERGTVSTVLEACAMERELAEARRKFDGASHAGREMKRYTVDQNGMVVESERGGFVRHADHLKAISEIQRTMENAKASQTALNAKVDELLTAIEAAEKDVGHRPIPEIIAELGPAWRACQ